LRVSQAVGPSIRRWTSVWEIVALLVLGPSDAVGAGRLATLSHREAMEQVMGGALEGRVVVVTGALGALGQAVAAAAEAAGAKVARLDLAPGSGDLVFGGLDLADGDAVGQALDDIAGRCGRIDGLVNIAGGFTWQTLAGGGPEAWERMFRINLLTAVTASHAALKHLTASAGGSIVNIGANAASRAGAGMGAYAASKAGVAKLTEALAEELGGANVRVNAILPSIIDTAANRRDMPGADHSQWVAPEAIARVVVFLLSDQAAAITGALIPVTHPAAGGQA
jgi:NAD(P)-dependent dehydrogenase (short-subunit alcohol dehydrogenase family)